MIADIIGQAGGFSFSPQTSLIALFIPLLLIVPGLVAVRLGLWTARRENPFTQLETLVMSALVSLCSLLLMYVGFSVWLWEPVVLDNLQGQSLPWYITGYLIHIVAAAVLGMTIGSFAYNYLLDNEARSRYNPWQYVFRQLIDSATIEVRTASGIWIRGHLTKAEESTGTRDLLLTSATVLHDTLEGDRKKAPNENIGISEEGEVPIDSESTDAENIHHQPDPVEKGKKGGIDNWKHIDNSLDEEFKTNDKVRDALDNDSAGYIQLDGTAIEAVRVPDGPSVNTNEIYEELSDSDRVHKRTALLGREFGYFIIEDRLRNLIVRLNRAASRWIITGLLWATMLAVTLGSAGVIEVGSMLGSHQAILSWLGLLTGVSIVELLRYYLDTPIEWRGIPISVGVLTPFIVGVALVEWWVVRDWPSVFNIISATVGLLGGITIGTVVHHLRNQYTATAALAVTAIIAVQMAFVSAYAFGAGMTPTFGRPFVVVGFASTFGLFCERIRIGKAGAYEDWATVLADTVATCLGISAAGLGIWSVGVAMSTGQAGYLTSIILGFIAVLAGAAAIHGVDERA